MAKKTREQIAQEIIDVVNSVLDSMKPQPGPRISPLERVQRAYEKMHIDIVRVLEDAGIPNKSDPVPDPELLNEGKKGHGIKDSSKETSKDKDLAAARNRINGLSKETVYAVWEANRFQMTKAAASLGIYSGTMAKLIKKFDLKRPWEVMEEIKPPAPPASTPITSAALNSEPPKEDSET